MHLTIVKYKDGREFRGFIHEWTPENGWFKLVGCGPTTAHVSEERTLYFSRVRSIVTQGDRSTIHTSPEGEDQDGLAQAKQYLAEGRKYGWPGTPKEKFDWE